MRQALLAVATCGFMMVACDDAAPVTADGGPDMTMKNDAATDMAKKADGGDAGAVTCLAAATAVTVNCANPANLQAYLTCSMTQGASLSGAALAAWTALGTCTSTKCIGDAGSVMAISDCVQKADNMGGCGTELQACLAN